MFCNSLEITKLKVVEILNCLNNFVRFSISESQIMEKLQLQFSKLWDYGNHRVMETINSKVLEYVDWYCNVW